MPDRRKTGQIGERTAERELRRRGYRILARNYRTRTGEVDLVARERDTVVFVEVKTRLGASYGAPEEAITPVKRSHLISAAQSFLQANGLEHADWRIDVVVVGPGRVAIHRNAVEEQGP